MVSKTVSVTRRGKDGVETTETISAPVMLDEAAHVREAEVVVAQGTPEVSSVKEEFLTASSEVSPFRETVSVKKALGRSEPTLEEISKELKQGGVAEAEAEGVSSPTGSARHFKSVGSALISSSKPEVALEKISRELISEKSEENENWEGDQE